MGENREYYVLFTDWSMEFDVACGVLTRMQIQKDGNEKVVEVIEWTRKDLSALRSGSTMSNGSMWREFFGILLSAEHFGRNFPINCLVTVTDNAAMRVQVLLDTPGRRLLCWLRMPNY